MLGFVVGATSYKTRENQVFGFDVLDLDTSALRRIPLGFFAHGFSESPRAPGRAAVFEKKGPGACYLDLCELVVLRTIEPSGPDRAFYGHGAYSIDGDVLYVVETRLDTRAGLISIRDAETFAVLGEVPTFGESPHDCLLSADGRTMALTNGGGPIGTTLAPSVTVVELAAAKLLDRVTFSEPRINAGHLAMTSGGDLAVVSAPRDGIPDTATGAVSFRTGGGRMVTMKKPPPVVRRMIGETLSVCIDEASGVVVATHPAGKMVTFWDLGSMRLLKSWDVPSPRGVTLSEDRSCFVVSCQVNASVRLVSTGTLDVLPRDDYGPTCVSGSHVYGWRPPASRPLVS